MADRKITQLPAAVAVALTDLLAKVNDPGGSPETQRATVSQLQDSLTGKINKAGDTFSGDVNFGNNDITNVSTIRTSGYYIQNETTLLWHRVRIRNNQDGDPELFLDDTGIA